MKNRAFTVLELVVAVVIVGVLATIGIPAYQNVLESSKQKACDTNLQTLKKAVEMYMMDHDAVPGALSQLNDKYIEKAFASVMSGKDSWKIKLAYFLAEGPQWGLAYAGLYGMAKLRCPANLNTSASAVSYGINCWVAGQSAWVYKNLPESTIIIADSASEIFNYPGATGASTAHYDSDFTPSVPADVKNRNSHRRVGWTSTEYFLRGINKAERKGSFNSTGMSFPDY